MMFSTCFEAKGSSSGTRFYMQVWRIMFQVLKLELKASMG